MLLGRLGVAGGVALAVLAAPGAPARPVRLDELAEDAEDDPEAWMMRPPAALTMPRDGSRVFVWGLRNALPISEAAGGAPLPEAELLRAPWEAAWFRQQSEATGCRWRQLAFGPCFGAARTAAGELFIWGSAPKGNNGKGTRIFLAPRPLLLDDLASDGRFLDVQCSESSVWALTVDGEVAVWEQVPGLFADLVTGGRADTVAAAVAGGRKLKLSRPVRQMSVGPSHAAFVTDDGNVYCIGSNICGECGMDPSKHAAASSVCLIRFQQRHVKPIACVSCGKSHTVAVGAEGQVLAWGDDSKIQLGLGDTRSSGGDERPFDGSRGYQNFLATGESMAPPSALRGGPLAPSFRKARTTSAAKYGEYEAHVQWKPQQMMDIPLEFERQVHGTPYPPPMSLKCGDDFTLVMVRDSPDWFSPQEESNRMFCCGENSRGQCGRSTQASQQILSAVKTPRNSFTHSVSCGSEHCLAVLKRVHGDRHELWAWGRNDKGQAGPGTSAGVVCPAARLRLPKDTRVETAWCGFSSSAAICSDAPPGSSSSLRRPASGAADADRSGQRAGE